MPRIATLVLVLALLAPAAAEAAVKPPRALLIACTRGLDAGDRSAVFEGVMQARRGAARMQMRFHLKARGWRAHAWSRIDAFGLEEWLTSGPRTTHYVYTKRIENLAASASYRMIVHFRWVDAAGDVIARDVAVTRLCSQPDLRPNVRPLSLAVGPGSAPDRLRYVATVGNAGRSDSGRVDVALDLPGGAQLTEHVVGLPARSETQVAFDAPRCEPGSTVSLRVDTAGAVDERDEVDNAASWACPA